MGKTITKTKLTAINTAKIEAIRLYEKSTKITVNDKAEINNEDNWLINDTSTICECGETNAIQVIYFKNDNQYQSIVGYCEACGEEI